MRQPRSLSPIAAGLLLAALVLAAPIAAQVYKWVDEKGTVHFTDAPPAKVPAEVIPMPTSRPVTRSAAPPPEPAASAADEAPAAADHPAEPAPAVEEESGATIVEGDTIIVDDGRADAATRYRANSPRNRPGQPIRQPNQPGRQPRRVR